MRTTVPVETAASSVPAPEHQEGGGREKALVEAARRGEEEAWKRIYDHLGEVLTRYAASRGITDPEDVTQDVMYAAARRIHRFDGNWENLRSWLFTIAYRRCADHHRRRARSLEQLTQLPPEDPDFDTSADGRFWADGEAREALSALTILNDRERKVVELRIIDEMTTRQVADATGLSPSNVRVIQSRALTRLRRYLEGNGGYLDKRFRAIFPPALLALDEMRLLRRLGAGAGGWLNAIRFGNPLETVSGPATVTGGLSHALAAVILATGMTAGTLDSGPSPMQEASGAAASEKPAIASLEGNRTRQRDDGRGIDLSGRRHGASASTDRQPVAILPGADSIPPPSLGTGRPGGSLTDEEPLSQLTAAVEEEGPQIDPVTKLTDDTAVERTTPGAVDAAETVTDDVTAQPDGDTVDVPETNGALTEVPHDTVAEVAEGEPDSLLDG